MKYEKLNIEWVPYFKVITEIISEVRDDTEFIQKKFIEFRGFCHHVDITDDASLIYWIKEFEKMNRDTKVFNTEHSNIKRRYFINIRGADNYGRIHSANIDSLITFLKKAF